MNFLNKAIAATSGAGQTSGGNDGGPTEVTNLMSSFNAIKSVASEAKAQVDQAKAQVEEAKAQVDQVKAQVEEAKNQVELAKETVSHEIDKVKEQVDPNKIVEELKKTANEHIDAAKQQVLDTAQAAAKDAASQAMKAMGFECTTKLKCFIACFIAGFVLKFLGPIVMFFSSPDQQEKLFAIFYGLGHGVSVASTSFLTGPKEQCAQMFDRKRLASTLSDWSFTLFTLFATLYLHIPGLAIMSTIGECMSKMWYCLSHIPFGRQIFMTCCPCAKCCCCCCPQPEPQFSTGIALLDNADVGGLVKGAMSGQNAEQLMTTALKGAGGDPSSMFGAISGLTGASSSPKDSSKNSKNDPESSTAEQKATDFALKSIKVV